MIYKLLPAVLCLSLSLGVVFAAADPQETYAKKLSQIDPKDAEAHVGIARWAMENNHLDIAAKELKTAIELQPNNERAQLLLRQVQARQTPDEAASEPKKEEPVATTPAPASPTAGGEFVSEDEIYRIRLFELKKGESVSVDFRNKVIDRFFDKMRGIEEFKDPTAQSKFKALPRHRQLQIITDRIDQDDREIRDDLLIKTDPKFMKDFRTGVWSIMTQSCSQVQCHGAATGKGGLKLFNVPGKSERADYTNFLIMSLWEKDGQRLIDRNDNDSSLVLQYGLPAGLARLRHPKPISPIFASSKAANYKRCEDWIKSLEGTMPPNYRTTYQPPVGRKLQGGASAALGLNPTPASGPTSKPVGNEPADPFNK